MIGTSDPQALADFYSQVLEKEPDWKDGGWFGFSAGGFQFTIGHHDKVKGQASQPERIILNFDTKEVKAEFDRVKAIGATVIAEPYHMGDDESMMIATFADPDGNYFQLTTPWEDTSVN